MHDREQWLAATLLAMTDTVADDFDLDRHLDRAAARLAELVDGAEVAVTLAGEGRHDHRRTVATGPAARALSALEAQRGTGPGSEAARANRRVSTAWSWPPHPVTDGSAVLRAADAFPLRHGGGTVGAAILYRGDARPMGADVAEMAQAVADAAALGVVQARTLARARCLAEQLQHALTSRVVIEQAKGVLAERLTVPVDEAFVLLRRHARDGGRRLDSVAGEVVRGALPGAALPRAS